MINFWIAAAGILVATILGYWVGYRACQEHWQKNMTEEVNQLIQTEISKVGEVYDETYRNVIRHLITIIQEELDTKDKTEE